MSFYASQFNNKSSRYCSSNLYGSNLSTVYADEPPPLDDTLEEDDGEIVFREKNSRKDSLEPKLDKDKSGPVSGDSDFNPWSKNDNKNVADGDFGDFSGFADFSSAFGGNTKSQNDSWFKNGDNDQSSVTNFNHNLPNHQEGISASSRKDVEKNEVKTNNDDGFGCFSGGDDSDFDDFCSFTSNNQNISAEKTDENSSKDSQINEISESKKTTKPDELFKNNQTLDGNSDQFNYSLGQNAKKSNIGSINGQPMSPTNDLSTSYAQNIASNTHSAMKPTCFSDDDDDFGDFSSSSFDDDGGSTKSPELVTNSQQTASSSQPNSNELQICHINESSSIQNSRGIENEYDLTGSKDSNEPMQLPQHNGSEADLKKNGKDIILSDKEIDIKNTDQSKENVTGDDKDNDEFGEFSTFSSSVTKPKEIKSKELPSNNIVNDDDNRFGEFGGGSTPSLPNREDDADDVGEFGAATAPSNENDKIDDNGFGDFGAALPPSPPSLHGNSDNNGDFGDFSSSEATSKPSSQSNDGDEFGSFGVVPASSSAEEKPKSDYNDDFGDFDAAFSSTTTRVSTSISTEVKSKSDNDDRDNEFGDFGSALATNKPDLHNNKNDDDDDFGDFGAAPATSKSDPHSNADTAATVNNDDDEDFGDFDSVPVTSKPDVHSGNTVANDDDDDDFGDFDSVPVASKLDVHSGNTLATNDDDDDDFGNFDSVPVASKPDVHCGNTVATNDGDDDDFGDFGVASSTNQQNKSDDYGDFADVKQPNSKSKSTFEPSSLKPPISPPNDDDEFGQFDSAPGESSDSGFADFKSSDNSSQGFAEFSSKPQKSMPSSFSTVNIYQAFPNKDVQQGQPSKLFANTSVIKPQQNTNPDRLENPIKKCFTHKDVIIESNIVIQMIEHEVQPEKSRAWQQLLTSEKDASLRFDWVLSEHQVKMLEGLSMLPVKIQTSVSFKPKGPKVPTPLFASSMGLLEPVKGVIIPFHHIEEIDPSQDPFGAPPEVGVQDLGFGKGSKKETSTILPTGSKENVSDTVSVSSSLDLDFLAPSTSNGESTKTESRGLFEDDLLGLGMFSAPSPSPKITNGKNIFKFNNTTIPMVTNEGNLSEQAKIVIKDFEDLSFMLSKVLMFPLKTKE